MNGSYYTYHLPDRDGSMEFRGIFLFLKFLPVGVKTIAWKKLLKYHPLSKFRYIFQISIYYIDSNFRNI